MYPRGIKVWQHGKRFLYVELLTWFEFLLHWGYCTILPLHHVSRTNKRRADIFPAISYSHIPHNAFRFKRRLCSSYHIFSFVSYHKQMNILFVNDYHLTRVVSRGKLFWINNKILNYSPPQFACSANQRPKSTTKKKTHKPLRTSWFSEKCLVFDNHKNLILTLAAWSAFLALFTWSPRTTYAKDHRLFKKSLPTNQRKPRSHDHKPRWSNTR